MSGAGRRARLRALPLLALLTLVACGGSQALDAARALTRRWFEAAESGDVDGAMALYGEPLFAGSGREEARRFVASIAARGVADAREPTGWQVQAHAGREGVGWFVTLRYRVRYGECVMRHRFVVHRPFAGGEAHIVGHHVEPEGACETRNGLAV